MHTIAFATCRRLAALDASDNAALDAVRGCGFDARPAVWDDPVEEWDGYDAVVIRSCWDYWDRVEEFRAWLDRLDALRVVVWNPTALLRWNLDKRYLRELEGQGMRVVPTTWVERGADTTLASISEALGAPEMVVKPVISANGTDTWRVPMDDVPAREADFARLVAKCDVMVQPFVREIERDGEWSLLFFAGRYSHAVVKRARRGHFLVQREHGGTAERTHAPAALIADAERILSCVRHPWLYARVDGCATRDGLLLMELEMFEPSLYLDHEPGAASRFAQVLSNLAAVRS